MKNLLIYGLIKHAACRSRNGLMARARGAFGIKNFCNETTWHSGASVIRRGCIGLLPTNDVSLVGG